MLNSPSSQSTNWRRSSLLQQTSFFFQPVQLHFQSPNLLVQRVALGIAVVRLPPPSIDKNLIQVFQRCPPPVRDLHRVYLELGGQLVQGPLAADGFDRHPRFELRAVLLSCRRHRFPSDSRL